MSATTGTVAAFDPGRTAAVSGLDGRSLPRTPEEVEQIERGPFGLLALAQAQMDTTRPGAAGLIDWYQLRTKAQTTAIFLDRLFASLDALPQELRALELHRILVNIEPSLEPAVRAEAEKLVAEGHEPRVALRAALGALLAARRRKHYWVVQHEIIPRQAEKAVESVFAATSDPHERARRVKNLVMGLVPPQRPSYDVEQAKLRLKEVGLSTAQIEAVLSAPPLTERHIMRAVAASIREGTAPSEAMRHGVEMALRSFFLDVIKSNGVARGVEFCGALIGAIVAAVVGVASTAAGIAIPLAQAEGARRAARRANKRQQQSPLSSGEIEQVVTAVLQSGATSWGEPQRQAALDYIRLNRLGRTTFVDPEERRLRSAFETARAAVVAQQRTALEQQAAVQRAKDTKVMIGVGIGAVALIGGALIYRYSR
jgi:hypothetical protein